jgi:hypothetical protein
MQDDDFKLKLTGAGASLDTQVSVEIARKIFNLVLGGTPSLPGSNLQPEENPEGVISAKQFVAEKRPANDTERLLCLAFYLTHYLRMDRFKTKDLTTLNRDAAQPRFSNATVTARNATYQQYLTLAGGGQKLITPRGEELVKALPDRQKVKAALEGLPLSRRRRRKPPGKPST